MNIFEAVSYKQFLRHHIRAIGRRGYITELSAAAGCTQSYFSQVLHGKPEITPDQALALGEALGLPEIEAEYFLLLVQHSRASTPKLKAHLAEKMRETAARRLSTESAVAATSDGAAEEASRDFYYASWRPSAVHILTACEVYQRPAAIAAHLDLPVREVEGILARLVEYGLVKQKGGLYQHAGKNLHLPTASLHNRLNHLNWRLRALAEPAVGEGIHYSSAFAISRADWGSLREKLLRFIGEQRKEIAASGSEDAFVFCCDLFKV